MKKRKMKSLYLRRTENEIKASPNQNLIELVFKGVLFLRDYCIWMTRILFGVNLSPSESEPVFPHNAF